VFFLGTRRLSELLGEALNAFSFQKISSCALLALSLPYSCRGLR